MLVIPAIDLIDGQCVRLLKGKYEHRTSYDLDPVEQALRFQQEGFKRLHVVDLDGARAGVGGNRRAIREIVQSVRIPVQTGGGIRVEEDVEELLDCGVESLILGTVALESPGSVEAWIERWGPQPFIVSLDLRNGRPQVRGWTGGGTTTLEEAVERISLWEVEQVICTDVERDGTLDEPGYAACRDLLERLPKPTRLIAAGGVSRPEHLSNLARLGVFGAIVGRALYEGDYPSKEFALAG